MQAIKNLRPDNPNKPPVKIKVKTNYHIWVIVNDNNPLFGTHAGIILISPNSFEIYDPNGSFHYPGIAEGSLRVFPIESQDIDIKRDIVKKYIDYQTNDGKYVYLYKFNVTKNDFMQIQQRIYSEDGCYGSLNCSICVSNALSGVSVFEKLEPDIRLPSNLKKAMDKIGQAIRLEKR